jgi:hypothetical protein
MDKPDTGYRTVWWSNEREASTCSPIYVYIYVCVYIFIFMCVCTYSYKYTSGEARLCKPVTHEGQSSVLVDTQRIEGPEEEVNEWYPSSYDDDV